MKKIKYLQIGLENVEVINIEVKNIEYMDIRGIADKTLFLDVIKRLIEADITNL